MRDLEGYKKSIDYDSRMGKVTREAGLITSFPDLSLAPGMEKWWNKVRDQIHSLPASPINGASVNRFISLGSGIRIHFQSFGADLEAAKKSVLAVASDTQADFFVWQVGPPDLGTISLVPIYRKGEVFFLKQNVGVFIEADNTDFDYLAFAHWLDAQLVPQRYEDAIHQIQKPDGIRIQLLERERTTFKWVQMGEAVKVLPEEPLARLAVHVGQVVAIGFQPSPNTSASRFSVDLWFNRGEVDYQESRGVVLEQVVKLKNAGILDVPYTFIDRETLLSSSGTLHFEVAP